MSTEHEDMARDTGAMLRATLQAALLMGEHFARTRATQSRSAQTRRDRAATRRDQALRDQQTRTRAERTAVEAQLRLVTTDAWWAKADRAMIADAWCTAITWRRDSSVAADAAATLRTRIQQRFQFDPESHTFAGSALSETAPEMDEALAHAAWRRYRTRATGEAVLDQVLLQQIRDDLDRTALAAFVTLHDQATAHLGRLDREIERETKRIESEGVERDGEMWLTTDQFQRRQTRLAELEGRDPTQPHDSSAGQPQLRNRWSVDVGVTLNAGEHQQTTRRLIGLERAAQQKDRLEQESALVAAENAIQGLGEFGHGWMRQYDQDPDRAYAVALVAPDPETRNKMWSIGSRLAAAEGELALLVEGGQSDAAEAVAAAQKVETLEKEMTELGEAGERWVAARKTSTTHAGEIHDRTLVWIIKNPVIEQDALAALRADVAGEPNTPTAGDDPTATGQGKPVGKPSVVGGPPADFTAARAWAREAIPDWYDDWAMAYNNCDTSDDRRMDEAEIVSRWRQAEREFRKSKLSDLLIGIIPDHIRFTDEWYDVEKTYRRLIRAGSDPRTLVLAAQKLDYGQADDPVELTIAALRAAGGGQQTEPNPRHRRAAGRASDYDDAELAAAHRYWAKHDPEWYGAWNRYDPKKAPAGAQRQFDEAELVRTWKLAVQTNEATAKQPAPAQQGGNTARQAAPVDRQPRSPVADLEYDTSEITAARAYFSVHDPEQMRKWNWKLSNMNTTYARDSVLDEMVLRHRTEIHDTAERRAAMAEQLDADGADAEAKDSRLLADLSNAKPAAWATTPPKSTPQTSKDTGTGVGQRERDVAGR